MASTIDYRDQSLTVSNKRFHSLISFAIEVAEDYAATEEECGLVADLEKRADAFYPGYDFDLLEEFPSLVDRKFWARIFLDLAHLVFLRKIGNQNQLFWQSSFIGDAYWIGRTLVLSVQEEEQAWFPSTLAGKEQESLES